jgi:hypothetical protein
MNTDNTIWARTRDCIISVAAELQLNPWDALNELGKAIENGLIKSRLDAEAQARSQEFVQRGVAKEVAWLGSEDKASWEDFWLDVEVSRPSLLQWLDSQKVPVIAPGAKRGRKASYDWDSAWANMCRIVRDEGLPPKQSDMVKKIQSWFSERYDAHPAESEIKRRVSMLYRILAGN